MTLSLVIPAYNEAKRIERCVSDIKSFFKPGMADVEFLIVVEKSTDGTLELARRMAGNDARFQIIDNQVHRGKGFAVRSGMLRAKGKIVFFMDCDLSTPLVEVLAFLAHFEAHPQTDVLIGSRQHRESQIIKKQHPLRRKMGQVFNFFVQVFAVKGITDTQCGFKAFRGKTVEPIFSRQKMDGFSFDVEILLLAEALGYKIEVLPVKWINSPESKVNIVKDSIKMFLDLLRMKRLVRKTLKTSPVQINAK
jgi:dolichyl-phosphate beta-glucosyltransferase